MSIFALIFIALSPENSDLYCISNLQLSQFRTLLPSVLCIQKLIRREKDVYVRAYVTTYIHTYIHTCIHTFIHTHIHTYTHTYIIHTYTNTYIHTYIHVYIHTSFTYIHNTYIHTYTHIHTYVHTYIHTYIQNTYIHTYVHTYIRTYIHTYIVLKHQLSYRCPTSTTAAAGPNVTLAFTRSGISLCTKLKPSHILTYTHIMLGFITVPSLGNNTHSSTNVIYWKI